MLESVLHMSHPIKLSETKTIIKGHINRNKLNIMIYIIPAIVIQLHPKITLPSVTYIFNTILRAAHFTS